MGKVRNMKNKIDEIFSKAAKSSYEKELKELSTLNLEEISYKILSEEEIIKLSEKILALPIEYKNIVFSRYSFNLTPIETEKTYEIVDAKEKLLYIRRLLSRSLKLKGKWIDDTSMELASNMALKGYTGELNDENFKEKPKYSRNFKKSIRDLNIKIENKFARIAKRVAMIFLVVGISFTLFLATNVQAREKFFDWIVEKYEQYSIFTPETINEDYIDKVGIDELKINYIPDGFELDKVHELKNIISYEFLNSDKNFISLSFYESKEDSVLTAIDTENATLEELYIENSVAYYWQRERANHIIWQQNGIECHISGNIEKSEIIKIAENISK